MRHRSDKSSKSSSKDLGIKAESDEDDLSEIETEARKPTGK